MPMTQSNINSPAKLEENSTPCSENNVSVDNVTPINKVATDDNSTLRDCVRKVLASYIEDLEGHSIENLYSLVLAEVEVPLLETILEHTSGNQSKASQMLGINRGTLRKKIKQYNIDG